MKHRTEREVARVNVKHFEEEARAPSSPPKEKETKEPSRRLLLVAVRVAVPSVPPFSSFPSCSPPGTWIHPYLFSRGEEEARAPPPPFPRKRRRRSTRRSSPLPRPCRRSPCSPCSRSSFLSYSPCYPHPPPPPSCFPDRLIVVFISFCPPPRTRRRRTQRPRCGPVPG